ncbi:MAG: transcription antitermination factor NusB [Treponema sp.]|jgi:N utilization substance protein B|nr:transcription antitermination factor NusB [Treponema sp.]
MASRRKGRILAFQALYSWEMNDSARGGVSPDKAAFAEGLLDFSWLEHEKRLAMEEDISGFSRILVAGTIENIGAIDGMIRRHLENWDISRLNRVDLAILRMSAYTLMYQSDMAPSIVINEAIGIAKEFGTGDSYRFINGVLDSIRRTLQNSFPAGPEAPQARQSAELSRERK